MSLIHPAEFEAELAKQGIVKLADVPLSHLALSAQKQDVWTVTKGPNAQVGSWGGHCVCAVAFDSKTITVVTWGQLKKMTWQFWNEYCDEAYAVLSNDWFNGGKDPSGFDVNALNADLKLLAA